MEDDVEANVSHGNAIILDFSYVCDMDYTAAKVQCVTIEFWQGPVYVVNLQFLRCLDWY